MSNQQNPKIYVKELSDIFSRVNFQNLSDYFVKQNQLLDFEFFDLDLSEATTELRVRHSLGRTPRDIIRTEMTGTGIVTIHRGLFDTQFMYVSSTAACKIRFFAGTYYKSPNPLPVDDSLVEQWIIRMREKREVPTGDIDSSNKKFLLSEAPLGDEFVKIYYDGALKRNGLHYTIEGKEISMVTAPVSNHLLDADYLY